jgi:hypothetical protein
LVLGGANGNVPSYLTVKQSTLEARSQYYHTGIGNDDQYLILALEVDEARDKIYGCLKCLD